MMTYLYSTLEPAGSSICIKFTTNPFSDKTCRVKYMPYQQTISIQANYQQCRLMHGTGQPASAGYCHVPRLTFVVQMSPSLHCIGTFAIDRKDQPKGICEPPMHSICLECTL